MTFLAPQALWLALIAAAIVALYLLKIRRRRVGVPSLEFWRQLVAETQVRSLFRQFKRWLSLLLWLLIAACLMSAVGNPIFTGGPMKSESIAVIIDDSASMQSLEPGEDDAAKSRLDLAKEAVIDFVGRRPVNDEWLLIEASSQPRVLQSWTRQPSAVIDALDQIAPRSQRGDLPAAVALAREIMSGRTQQRMIVVSDGDAGRLEQMIKDDERILYWPIGHADDNLGITQVTVRSQLSAHHVFLRVFNSGKEDVETQLVFEIDEATVKVEPFKIGPRTAWEKTVVIENSAGGVLRLSIDRPDALAVDNEAYAVLEPIRSAAVFVVTPPDESFIYEQALLAMQPLVDPETSQTLTPEQYEALSELKQ
ncbi:MAG: VWA domain-containing protein, partial [Planctomycetaceae bacterium]